MSFDFANILVPIVFLWYAYVLLKQKPAFGDSRRGFPTRRAKESKEVWNYVQRVAGICCLVMGIAQVVLVTVNDIFFSGNDVAYWVNLAVKGLCIVGIFPLVNFITARKYPKKN